MKDAIVKSYFVLLHRNGERDKDGNPLYKTMMKTYDYGKVMSFARGLAPTLKLGDKVFVTGSEAFLCYTHTETAVKEAQDHGLAFVPKELSGDGINIIYKPDILKDRSTPRKLPEPSVN